MKIIVVGNYYYPEHMGGVEVVSYNLVKYYRQFGHQVRWIADDVPPTYRSVEHGDVPMRAWNFAEENLGFPLPIPFRLGDLFKLYTNIKWCDVVHIQDCLYMINIFAFIFSKILRKPVLITQYAKFIPYRQLYKRAMQIIAYRTIGWLMFTVADKTAFITENVRDNMRYINPVTMTDVVPLGVDLDFYAPLSPVERSDARRRAGGDDATPVVLFVGRMVERKGIHLIHALIERHPEWHWVLVGRSDDYDPGQWKFPNMTYFQNISNEQLRECYASADLLVHPSIGEGFTLIVSESLACGLPVVISEESLYEIEPEDRRLFFSIKPEVDEIDAVLSRVLKDPASLEEMRQEVRQFALKRLSWKRMAEQYLSILHDVSGL